MSGRGASTVVGAPCGGLLALRGVGGVVTLSLVDAGVGVTSVSTLMNWTSGSGGSRDVGQEARDQWRSVDGPAPVIRRRPVTQRSEETCFVKEGMVESGLDGVGVRLASSGREE